MPSAPFNVHNTPMCIAVFKHSKQHTNVFQVSIVLLCPLPLLTSATPRWTAPTTHLSASSSWGSYGRKYCLSKPKTPTKFCKHFRLRSALKIVPRAGFYAAWRKKKILVCLPIFLWHDIGIPCAGMHCMHTQIPSILPAYVIYNYWKDSPHSVQP